MSAPLAGKFADHYEVLGVDSKAEIDAIKAAYAKLAVKYSPANAATGNKEKFAELNASYEVLSDPGLRKAFDGVRGGNDDTDISFPVEEFLGDLQADEERRMCLLTLLYHRRKANSISPGISMRQVESVIRVDPEQLGFISWVLKQQGLIVGDDKSRLLITVGGIEYVQAHRPDAPSISRWLRSSGEQEAMRPAPKPEAAKPLPGETPAAKPPLRAAPELTGSSMATAGLSSLRTALLKSIGTPPEKEPAKAAGETTASQRR